MDTGFRLQKVNFEKCCLYRLRVSNKFDRFTKSCKNVINNHRKSQEKSNEIWNAFEIFDFKLQLQNRFNMQVISGKYKGLKLHSPKDYYLRPTLSRIKENVFNLIQDHVENAVFLDLYCGSGQIGIEALSRGAKKVFFVDQNTFLAEKNLKKLKQNNYEIIKSNSRHFITKSLKFDIIYMDPPFNKNPVEEVELIQQSNICKILILEQPRTFKHIWKGFSVRIKMYGNTQIIIFTAI